MKYYCEDEIKKLLRLNGVMNDVVRSILQFYFYLTFHLKQTYKFKHMMFLSVRHDGCVESFGYGRRARKWNPLYGDVETNQREELSGSSYFNFKCHKRFHTNDMIIDFDKVSQTIRICMQETFFHVDLSQYDEVHYLQVIAYKLVILFVDGKLVVFDLIEKTACILDEAVQHIGHYSCILSFQEVFVVTNKHHVGFRIWNIRSLQLVVSNETDQFVMVQDDDVYSKTKTHISVVNMVSGKQQLYNLMTENIVVLPDKNILLLGDSFDISLFHTSTRRVIPCFRKLHDRVGVLTDGSLALISGITLSLFT